MENANDKALEVKIRLVETYEITGTIEVVTGLHIGAGKETLEIGGVDGPVVKHPYSGEPYIPGSSLKGKLRSLMEWATQKVPEDRTIPYYGSDANGDYEPDDEILRIFGVSAKNWGGGPTRLIVRDSWLERDWLELVKERDLPLVEEKTEVTIDRIAGKAAKMGPRTMERVPAGSRFRLEMLFRVYDVDGDGGRRDRECLNKLIKTMKLLEQDALGGSGSRGYGRVRLQRLKIRRISDDRGEFSIQEKFDKLRRYEEDVDFLAPQQ